VPTPNMLLAGASCQSRIFFKIEISQQQDGENNRDSSIIDNSKAYMSIEDSCQRVQC